MSTNVNGYIITNPEIEQIIEKLAEADGCVDIDSRADYMGDASKLLLVAAHDLCTHHHEEIIDEKEGEIASLESDATDQRAEIENLEAEVEQLKGDAS